MIPQKNITGLAGQDSKFDIFLIIFKNYFHKYLVLQNSLQLDSALVKGNESKVLFLKD